MTCLVDVRASGQDRRLAHALPFREGATQHREPLRQSGKGPTPQSATAPSHVWIDHITYRLYYVKYHYKHYFIKDII